MAHNKVGVSLEGSVIITRNDANEKLYGKRVTAKELLNGTVTPPPEADALYRALGAKFHSLGNTGAMYTRNRSEDGEETGSTSHHYKSTSISKPGTLRAPPSLKPKPQIGSYNQYSSSSAPAPPPSYQQPPQSSSYSQPQYQQQQSYGYQQPQPPVNNNSYPRDVKPPVPPPIPGRQQPAEPLARALYAFNGEQAGDLSFREGEIITIVEKTDSQEDWWTGKIGHRQGVVSLFSVALETGSQAYSIFFC